MRAASRNGWEKASSSRPAGAAEKRPVHGDDARDDSSPSNYQSLESIASSESRDDTENLSNLLDKDEEEDREETYHYSVSESTSGEGSNQSKNPIARLRGKTSSTSFGSRHREAPPPPPTAPPPTASLYRGRRSGHGSGSGSQYESFEGGSHHISNSSSNNSAANQQKKALVSLLTEMRSLEQQMQQQAHDHAVERHAMVQSLDQQAAHIKQLEASNQTLQRQNEAQKRHLKSVLFKLDKFATGCWKFSSASVKKMSEALHIQVHEWGRLYSIDTNNGMSSPEEDAAMENATMEKLQDMHLEIRTLKVKNFQLKEKLKKVSRKRRGGRGSTGGGDDGSVASSMSDDEVTHMSGVTQMTATTTLTSTTKLMDAMSGFLNEHEGKSVTTPQSIPRRKVVQITSPRSILKPTSRYDPRQGRQRRNEQPMAKQSRSSRHSQQHQTGNDKISLPPKSPGKVIRSTQRGHTTTNNDARKQESRAFADFDAGFANFDDFAVGENDGEVWPTSWGGDEESEV